MTVDEIVKEVSAFGCDTVEITGGEPLLQPGSRDLMEALLARGNRVLLETGGSLPIEDVPSGVIRIVDVKCPGSGEADRNRWENLDALGPDDQVKFVVKDREDYDWAVRVVRDRALLERCAVLFAPVHDELEPGELAGWVLEDRLRVRVQIQLHKVLWPGVTRGV